MQDQVVLRIVVSNKTANMLKLLRENHIDIKPYVIEEVNNVLPNLFQEIIENLYSIKVVEGK